VPELDVLTASGIAARPPTWKVERDRASRTGTPLAIVVCTRNRPLLLARALFSLAALTYHDVDIIVVDNDSDDRATHDVFAAAAARSPHPMRYSQETRTGLSWARNAGLAATSRDLVAFTDDDVVVDSNWASEIVRAFEGSSSELLGNVLRLWWERVGETRASGILKLMMSEVRNFPEIAQFWIDEVISPAHNMVAELVQRGIDSGEFRPVRVDDVVHALISPLLFLVMNKHSLGACVASARLDPRAIIEAQIDLVLNGLHAPAGAVPAKKAKGARR
jgi:glycosyltransferase involved in cell wall biosynthesis